MTLAVADQDMAHYGQPQFEERDRALFFGPSAVQHSKSGLVSLRLWVGNSNDDGEMIQFHYTQPPDVPLDILAREVKHALYANRVGIRKHYGAVACDIICGMLFQTFAGHIYPKKLSFEQARDHLHV